MEDERRPPLTPPTGNISSPTRPRRVLYFALDSASLLRLLAGIMLLLWIWQVRSILLGTGLILTMAALLATILHGPVSRLARRGIPRWLAILLLYGAVALVIVGILELAVPVVTTEFRQIRTNLPGYLQTLQAVIHRWAPTVAVPSSVANLPWQDIVTSLLRSDLLATGLGNQATGLLAGLVDLFVLLILAYLLVLQENIPERLVARWVPPAHQERALTTLQLIARQIRRWMAAQLMLGFYFALAFGVGLLLLRVPFALSIAVIGGVLELFPYVGGAIAATLAFLVGLGQSPLTGLATLLLWILVAEVEAHIVAPALYGRALHISSSLVLIALYLGYRFLGVVGVLLAIPLVIVLQTLLNLYWPASNLEHD